MTLEPQKGFFTAPTPGEVDKAMRTLRNVGIMVAVIVALIVFKIAMTGTLYGTSGGSSASACEEAYRDVLQQSGQGQLSGAAVDRLAGCK
jgi:hypothetical protein